MLRLIFLLCLLFLSGCDDHALNDPYPNQSAASNTLYTAFSEQPKHLDPAKSFSANEWIFIGHIYETPLEYNYLIRPYQLQPLLAQEIPLVTYDAKSDISTYVIKIKPGILYKDHPALARDSHGNYYYHNLTLQQTRQYNTLKDFKHSGTREVIADDFINEIKRLADPKVNSPVFGFLNSYIVGLSELRSELMQAYRNNPAAIELDLRQYNISGVNKIDEYTYEIKIHGNYPQFKYWLAMSFFAPIPWEASVFYSQPGLQQHDITLDWYPIGTGPFYLIENNPERRMVLQRNPDFHPDFYPTVGMPEDAAKGLLERAGERLPFLDQIIFSLEKESIPYWDKFLQGYYDSSGISSDVFSTAIGGGSGLSLTEPLLQKNIRLEVSNTPTVVFWGFNMLDETVGGYSAKQRKLRKAISLAFDVEEYIIIFANGRATLANGPIPPGILGYNANPPEPPNLSLAKKLLAEAGYPNGRNPKTGEPLQLYFESMSSGSPESGAQLAWFRKQFDKLGIDLIVRSTDYNRFMEKLRTGNAQMFVWAWGADYPDPENFLFLLYGPNSKVKDNGENATNYSNPNFDRLYEKFKAMGDDPARIILIEQMLAILQEDLPWIWGYFPQSFGLRNSWYYISKPGDLSNNYLKYVKIDPKLRAQKRLEWNQAIFWPIFIVVLLILILILPAFIAYRRSENATAKRVP